MNNLNELQPTSQPKKKPGRALGILSLIFGILSIDFYTGFLGIPFGVTAIVLALVDKKKNKMFGDLSIPGLALGSVGTVLAIGKLVLTLVYVAIYFLYFILIFSQIASAFNGYAL